MTELKAEAIVTEQSKLIERLRAWKETPYEGDPMIDALLTDVPEAADHIEAQDARIASQAAEIERLRESNLALTTQLTFYADLFCEGWCQGKDPKACAAIGEDNCSGCPAVVTLARQLEAKQ